MEDYVKVKTAKLLDLDAVALEYNISRSELIAFHNSRCVLTDLLHDHLPKYVPYIFLPKNKLTSVKREYCSGLSFNYPASLAAFLMEQSSLFIRERRLCIMKWLWNGALWS